MSHICGSRPCGRPRDALQRYVDGVLKVYRLFIRPFQRLNVTLGANGRLVGTVAESAEREVKLAVWAVHDALAGCRVLTEVSP